MPAYGSRDLYSRERALIYARGARSTVFLVFQLSTPALARSSHLLETIQVLSVTDDDELETKEIR